MAEFYYDNLAKNLPDAYRKDIDSNNYKILEMERLANADLRIVLESIANILDIDNATGATLDMYGERFGQLRGAATDAQYITMIKSKIIRGLCNGSYKNIVDAICYTFGCGIDDVLITETETPLTLKFEKAPLDKIIKAGFNTEQALQIIKRLLPVTAIFEEVNFEGTFELGAGSIECPVCGEIITDGIYCSTCVDENGNPVQGKMILTEADYDTSAGLAISEDDQSIGGYLGYLGSNESSVPLPI